MIFKFFPKNELVTSSLPWIFQS